MSFTLTILDDANHSATVSKQTIGRAGEAGEVITVVVPLSLYSLNYDAYLHFLLPDGTSVYKGPYTCNSASFPVTIGATDSILSLEGTLTVQFVLKNGSAVVWKSEEKRLDVNASVNATDPATVTDHLYVETPTTFVSGNYAGYNPTTHKLTDMGVPIDAELTSVEAIVLQSQISSVVNNNVINVMYPPAPLVGAVGDGTADDSTAIQAIIDYVYSLGGGTILFPERTFLIETALALDDYISLKGMSKITSKINAIGAINAIDLNGGERITIKDLNICGDGTTAYGANSTSLSGILTNGARNVTIEDCWIQNFSLHGINFTGGCWLYNITNCDIRNTYSDGIFCIADSVNQKNAINIKGCHISDINESGINHWGLNISIEGCSIESTNQSGIRISAGEGSGTYSAVSNGIKGNYFEGNKGAPIFLYGSTNRLIDDLSIHDNYLKLDSSEANVGITALIMIAGTGTPSSPVIRFLRIFANNYNTTTLAYISGGDQLNAYSLIDLASDYAFTYILLPGNCRVVGAKNKIVLPGIIYAKGIAYTTPVYSDHIAATTTIIWPVPLSVNQQYIQCGIYVYTDYTSYQVRFRLMKRDKKSVDAFTEVFSTTYSGTASGYVEKALLATTALWAAARFVEDVIDFYVEMVVSPITPGTYLRIGNLCIDYV